MSSYDQSPTASLREEHELILKVLNRLDEMLAEEKRGGELDFDTFESCVTFFRLFTDKFHHAKEEDLLFPELAKEGLPSDSGPVASMLQDHAQGREYVGEMVAEFEAARAGDERAGRYLREAAQGYIDLLVDHITREDASVFTMADDMITGSACSTLCSQYEDVCAMQFEGQTKADLERLAEQII